MNPLKKIYCRVFQTCFHVAIPLLPYREPETFDSITRLEELFHKLGHERILLVTDSFLRSSGATAPLEEYLTSRGFHLAVYDATRPNPTVENVEQALKLYHEEGCQCLIAFGGGSSMDCAKVVGARVAYPNKSVNQMGGILRVRKQIPTLVAIPTTAGTGSEVTLAAVITDPETHHKYAISSFPLIPRYAVLDPHATYTLPPHLTATTGMDALTHAVEAYIGRSTTKHTREMALEATRLIFANIETAYAQPEHYEARSNMLQAAYLAGNAFSQSYVGYVHAVAHSLGGRYNIPHGLANSVLLPYVLDAYGETAHKKLHELAIAAGVSDAKDSDAVGAEKLIAAIRGLNERMGIPTKLQGIREEDVPAMARYADKEANPLYPVPVLMDAKALEQFYYIVMDRSEAQ